MQTLVFNLVALAGACAQGLTGFGSGTVTATALVMWFPFREVVPVVAMLVMVPNCLLAYFARHELDWRRGPVAALSLTAGVVAGAHLLAALPVALLRRGLGAVILAYVLFMLYRVPMPTRVPAFTWREGTALGLSAILAGIIVGAIGVAPIPLLVYISVRYPKSAARAVMTQAFLLSAAAQNLMYLRLGLLTPHLALLALTAVPGVAIGLILGNQLHYRVRQRTFIRGLALVLLLPAIKLLLG